MNSPPSSRYNAASAPITPTSEIALEIGCDCITRLMPQTTATAAKIMKRSASIIVRESLGQSHHEAGEKQVGHGHRKHEGPGEAHELVIAEARESAANPNVHEENDEHLGREPDDRHERERHRGNQEDASQYEERDANHGERDAIERTGGAHCVQETQHAGPGHHE